MTDIAATFPEFEEWRRVTEAATPGPWAYYGEDLWQGDAAALAEYDRTGEEPWPYVDKDWPDSTGHLFHGDVCHPRDAEFIAAARQAMPWLLEAVERLTIVALRTGRVNAAYISRVLRDGLPETWPDPDGGHQ